MTTQHTIGKQVKDISDLLDIFEAQEGVIEQIIGKTGNGKTYEGTRRAMEFLKKGNVVYTTWRLILPDTYDERQDFWQLFWGLLTFKKRYYVFDFKKNWRFLDIDRPDLTEFVSSLTDCYVFLDEGQDIFDSYDTRMSQLKRKSLTRTRHLRKTLIIISQRAQAVHVTARANIQYFYKCVKTRAWFFPFWTYFKVYRTEEMDDNNYPVWEDRLKDFKAELWRSHFARQAIYNAFNSWYLRAGIPKSQEINFEAYVLNVFDKITQLFRVGWQGLTAKKVIVEKVYNEVEDRKYISSVFTISPVFETILPSVVPKPPRVKKIKVIKLLVKDLCYENIETISS